MNYTEQQIMETGLLILFFFIVFGSATYFLIKQFLKDKP